MINQTINYHQAEINYLVTGSGSKVILCLHGYSEDASNFLFLEKYLPVGYLLISLDLPYHGKSTVANGTILTAEDFARIVKRILLALFPQENYMSISLIGFSLGGRIALSIAEVLPGFFSKIILLAPDGLKVNPWYWFSTQTVAGNRFFSFTMRKPYWFFRLLKFFHRLGLVNKSIFKFVDYYVGNTLVRQQLYERWTGLRKFKPNLPLLKKQIAENSTQLRLIYGEHDKIIRYSSGNRFCKGIEDFCNLKIIDAGHQILYEKYAAEIVDAITN